MSSAGSSANFSSVYIFLAVLVLLVLRRLSVVVRGSKVSRGRSIAFAIYYLAFASGLIAISIVSGGVSPYFLAVYAAVGALGVYGAYVLSNSRIGFWKGADGSIYFRGAIIVYVFYVVALILRIVIDLAFIGPQAFTFTSGTTTTQLSSAAVDAGIAADVLLSLGAGLLTGRNIRILKRYALIRAGKEQAGETPPKVTLV